MNYESVLDFYKEKSVLVTGNTGFKGSWLTMLLLHAGAKVTGYSLHAPTQPALFQECGLEADGRFEQIYADVRDLDALKQALNTAKPEIVFHLAAQPIVRDSYKDPVNTYATNVMGTVNLCEAVRTALDENGAPVVRSFLNVTTDKVYRNNEWSWGYRETDVLDGFDPYSNSKSCSELVTHSYRNAFFDSMKDSAGEPFIRVSTARAGNVIGGGDFSNDRIIPDCVRAIMSACENTESGGRIAVRNPYSTRPFEHVLEPLFAYLLIAKAQYEDSRYQDYYNVGPDDQDCVNTGDLVSLFCDTWNRKADPVISWENRAEADAPHEAGFLKLDCSKLKQTFGWKPAWHISEAIEQTVSWTRVWMEARSMPERERAKAIWDEMEKEIRLFLREDGYLGDRVS
ncbi:MAG: CDP-glucose 4,6-dehydratase [Lachnospiraceae bacterium]|nr:CDP-glucose 4,6-dehydratase [Lachnospiraceae bacterium]